MPWTAFDLGRAGRVTQHEDMRRRAVDQPERHSRVQRVHERALPFHEQELASAARAFDHERFRGAREEVGDDRIDGDAPPRDGDAGLTGRHEDGRETAPAEPRGRARPRPSSCRSRSPNPTVRTMLASTSRFAPVGTLRPSGGLRRSRSVTPRARASSVSSGSSERNSCRPLSTSSPASMLAFRRSRHAGGNRPPCVATPTTATVGSRTAARPRPFPRSECPRGSPPLASSRGSRPRDRARSGRSRASSCRSARRARNPRRG